MLVGTLELLNMFLSIILLIISAVSKGIADYIIFNTDYMQKRYYGQKRNFFERYLPFLFDWWHFFDAVRISCFIVLIIMFLGLQWWWFFIIFFLHGLVFEITYGFKKIYNILFIKVK